MNTVVKQSLLVGISLALAALTARRLLQETEVEGSLDKPVPPAPPKIDKPDASRADTLRIVPKAAPKAFTAPTVTFSGKLVRNGPSFALRETAGALYPLDSANRALAFEGKDVRVTGKLDLDTRLLYVDAIESYVA